MQGVQGLSGRSLTLICVRTPKKETYESPYCPYEEEFLGAVLKQVVGNFETLAEVEGAHLGQVLRHSCCD